MDRHLTGARDLARAIFRAEDRVAAIRESVISIGHDARAQEFGVGADGTVTDTSQPETFGSATAAEAHLLERTRLRDALVHRIESVLQEAFEVDSMLVQAMPADAFDDAGPQGVVDPLVARTWSQMSDEERRAVLEQMAVQLADEYGLDDFDVLVEDLEDQDGDGVDDEPDLDLHGFWSDDDKTLHLDVNELGDPDLINTMAHEVRHALQNEMARDNNPGAWDDALIAAGLKDDPWDPPEGVTRDDAETWEHNFDDYQAAEDDFDAYYNQPVESDAREAGEDYVEQLTPEQLDRHREEAS
jgi:hypothetical protein